LPVHAAPSGRHATLLSQLLVPVSLGAPSAASIPVRTWMSASASALLKRPAGVH